MVNKKKCVLCGQQSSRNVTLFSFPRNMREPWAEFCSIPLELLPKSALLCSQHFTREQFKSSSEPGSGRRLSLKQDAVPSLRSITSTAYAETAKVRHTDNVENGKGRIREASSGKKFQFCCICGNVAVNEALKVQFLRFPRDESFRNAWLESLRLTEFKPSYRLCQRHFKEGNPDNLPTRAIIFEGEQRHFEEAGKSELIQPCCTPMLNISVSTTETSINWTTQSTGSITEGVTSASTNLERNGDCLTTVSDKLTDSSLNETENSVTTPVGGSTPVGGDQRRPLRHFFDFDMSDLETPRRKRRCLQLGRSQIIQYQRKIDALKHQNVRLKKRVISLEEALENVLNQKTHQ